LIDRAEPGARTTVFARCIVPANYDAPDHSHRAAHAYREEAQRYVPQATPRPYFRA